MFFRSHHQEVTQTYTPHQTFLLGATRGNVGFSEKSIPTDTGRRTRRGVAAGTWARAIPPKAHWVTGALTGKPTPTRTRWKFCAAAKFPEIVFARWPSDPQHPEANSIDAQVFQLFLPLDGKKTNPGNSSTSRDVLQDRQTDVYVRLAALASGPPSHWRPRCRYQEPSPLSHARRCSCRWLYRRPTKTHPAIRARKVLL